MTQLAEHHQTMLGRATIGDQLRRHAQHTPDKAAIVFYFADGTREVHTYGSLNARVNRMARALQEFGVKRGDCIAMMSHNSPDYVAAYYASLKLGAMFTGINFTFTEREISYQINHAEPTVLIVEDIFVDRVASMADKIPSVTQYVVSNPTGSGEAPKGWVLFSHLLADEVADDEPVSDVTENDVAMLVYTSGTEASPKGVMISHRNFLISTTPAHAVAYGIKPSDVYLLLMPLCTTGGLGSMTNLTLIGATLVLLQRLNAENALRTITDEGVTIIEQTPTFYLAMTQVPGFHDMDMSCLERCFIFGGIIPQVMIDEWHSTSTDIVWGTCWGMSELVMLGSLGWFATLEDIPDGDPTWIGKPVPQLEIRVVDQQGNAAEIGELICRSPSVMLGYYKDKEKTAKVMRDGWFYTGDMVRIDKKGNLFFYDRIKDMIKTGGMNVSSQEVESILYQHPAVMRTAVVGLPDPKWMEAVTAFVVLKPDVEVTSEALIGYCKEQLAGYKVPKAIHIVDSLPTGTYGKLLKRELRRQYSY
jgi:acyl-CoA synthetase (AMP-forming)/AMP-acid ligase II